VIFEAVAICNLYCQVVNLTNYFIV
jgi:hypothetical protein